MEIKEELLKKEVKKADRNGWLWAEVPRNERPEIWHVANTSCSRLSGQKPAHGHSYTPLHYTPTWTLRKLNINMSEPPEVALSKLGANNPWWEYISGFYLKLSPFFRQTETQTFPSPALILSHCWLIFILVSQRQTDLLCYCFIVANKQLSMGWKVA